MIKTCKSSGELTSNTAVKDGISLLYAVLVLTDGTNAATIRVYDNDSAASGTLLFEAVVSGNENEFDMEFPWPVRAENGLYAQVSGTGASCIVYYE